MSDAPGWQPIGLTGPAAQEHFGTSPFARLARTHALSAAGDALVAVALAGSLFFSLPADEARGRVALYLVLTMAPFAVVAPLIGPAIDRARGGRRWMIVGSAVGRGAVCALMIGHVDSLLLFPEAFAVLVLGKGYQVARSAVVPSTVRTDAELVEANSKLSLLSGILGFVAAGPGLLALTLGGPEWTLALAVITFTAAAFVGLRLPRAAVAPEPEAPAERAELRSVGIVLAASAMGLLRGIVGFLTLLLAFDFRGEEVPTWHFGVVLAFSVVGTLLGAVTAARIRQASSEESMLIGALVATLAAAAAAVVVGGLAGAVIMATTVGAAASTGKLAFDSIVQRDAPDANRGRSFARFETRFQIIWVVGAFLPVPFGVPARPGYVVVALAAGFAAFTYFVGLQMARHRHAGSRPPPAVSAAAEVQERLQDAAGRVGRQAAGKVRQATWQRARNRAGGRVWRRAAAGEGAQPRGGHGPPPAGGPGAEPPGMRRRGLRRRGR